MAVEAGPDLCYVDTSALVKRYIEESGSDAFDAFCALARLERLICPLVGTEFSGVLQRRLRSGMLNARQVAAVHRRFLADVAAGGWGMIEFGSDIFSQASDLMFNLGAPLATLDALHLACALQHGVGEFATADNQLAAAARKARLHVHTF